MLVLDVDGVLTGAAASTLTDSGLKNSRHFNAQGRSLGARSPAAAKGWRDASAIISGRSTARCNVWKCAPGRWAVAQANVRASA